MATFTSKELAEQLSDLQQVLVVARRYGTPDRASQAGLNSLLRREHSLKLELKIAEMKEADLAVEIAIGGDPVRDHAVSISFFGQLLTTIQSLTNAVAQVLANAQTSRGIVRDDLILRNRFELATTFESSFGAGLRLPAAQQPELPLHQMEKSAADVVCQLLDGQALEADTVEVLSSSRVRGHYAGLVELIGKQGAQVIFRTQSDPEGSTMTAQQARDRFAWLDLLKTTNEETSVEGELVGGSIETRKFEIKVRAGDIFKGSVSDRAIAKMRELNWGARVTAILEVSTSIHEEAGLERVTYTLLDIDRL